MMKYPPDMFNNIDRTEIVSAAPVFLVALTQRTIFSIELLISSKAQS